MPTPPATFLQPHPPAAPVPILLTTDCTSLIPPLCLPPALATTENVLLSTTFSIQSSSTFNLEHPQTVNPLFALTPDKQHSQMTVVFHPPKSTTEPSSSHQHTLQEWITVPNSALDPASPQESPVLSTHPSVAPAEELSVIDCSPSEAS